MPQASAATYARVLELLEKGSLPGDIRGHLVGSGYGLEQATAIVDEAIRLQTQQYASQGIDINDARSLAALGRRNILLGALLFGVGLTIIFATVRMAGESAAPFFILEGGLIASGIALFFRGLNQAGRARSLPKKDPEPRQQQVNPRSRRGRRKP
jgi:hypothetical protein